MSVRIWTSLSLLVVIACGGSGTGRFTLTVIDSGSGHGTVTSMPGGIDCGNACSASYDGNTTVTLTATAAPGSLFSGWSGANCSGTGACSIVMTQTTSVTATFTGANVVFVTSTTYQAGALGGLSGADNACQERAAAAGLPGTYRAWLSTSGAGAVDAIARLGTARGWVRPDGKPFVDTTADLAGGRIMYPPRIDEFGHDVGQVTAVTGTTVDGTLDRSGSTTCSDYTDVGAAGFVVGGWSSAGSSMFTAFPRTTCSFMGHLYCLGIDATVPVPPTSASGRRAFVTDGVFIPGGGVSSADAMCASEAKAAGLPGTFLAALATSSASAQSRFDLTGATWVRADGVPLAPTASALVTDAYMDVAFNVNASGTTWFGNSGVWTGAPSWSSSGNATSTCSDYTSKSGNGAIGGRAGDTKASTLFGFDPAIPCNATYVKLLCLQQ